MKGISRAIGTGLLLATLCSAAATAQQPAPRPDPDLTTIATEAYVYGFPIVLMYVTERVQTNVAEPRPGKAPVNQLASLFEYPTAELRDVIAPDLNTLYAITWLDLSNEPMVIQTPDTNGLYYVMKILDYWTNVIAAPGKRTTGTKAQNIAITGPSWRGQVPESITSKYRAPTNGVWVINRIQTNGVKDYTTVNALQRALKVTPLSKYGTAYTPPKGTVDPSIDMKTPPAKQVQNMSADEFFTTLARALKQNPPASADAPLVRRMAYIGIVPGQEFKTNPEAVQALEDGAKAGFQRIAAQAKTAGRIQNGWQTLDNCGNYGTEYTTRAVVALLGLGCNLAEDALYPTTTVDAQGKTLNGAHSYVLRFPAGEAPPVNAFWSVTMYDADMLLVDNPLDRYAVSSWNDLKVNADGSIDIYLQHKSPGAANESNWLPAPPGDFMLITRLYWPKQSAITGSWSPPGVRMVQVTAERGRL